MTQKSRIQKKSKAWMNDHVRDTYVQKAKADGWRSRAVFKLIQVADIDWTVGSREAGVVETAFWDAADERHLAAFETDTDAAAGARSLAFTTATGGFAAATGFALTKPFATVFGAGTGFKIVQSHKNSG